MRRARAIKAIQDEVRADRRHLAVWLTLPVTPEGLQPDALAVVRTTLAARVDLAGVDVPGDAGPAGAPSPWRPLYRIPGEPVSP